MKQTKSNLESERILLRKLNLFDTRDVYVNIRDKETNEWALSLSRVYPKKAVLRFIRRALRLIRMTLRLIREELRPLESKKQIKLGIVLKETGRVIGIVSNRTLIEIDSAL